MHLRACLLLVVVPTLACGRKDRNAPADAASDAAPSAKASADAAFEEATHRDAASEEATHRDAGIEPASVEPVEARRLRVTSLEDNRVLFGDAGPLLAKHFDGARGSFDVQVAPLTAKGRRALFISDATKSASEGRPMAAVVDASGAIVWSKDHPVAGIKPPVGPVAIAAAPLGRVAMAACDPPTSIVALRLWDDDGFPFADFQAITEVESCDAVSLLYWPDHGWIVVSARPGSTRGAFVRESGSLAWDKRLELGVRPRAGAPAAATLAPDSADTFVLVQLGQVSARDDAPLHALAFRYDLRGRPLWDAPVDLGESSAERDARSRLALLRSGVHVTLPSGRELDLRSTGEVTRR